MQQKPNVNKAMQSLGFPIWCGIYPPYEQKQGQYRTELAVGHDLIKSLQKKNLLTISVKMN